MICPQSSICRSGRPLALEGPRRSQEWALPVGQGICSPGLQSTEPSRRGPPPSLVTGKHRGVAGLWFSPQAGSGSSKRPRGVPQHLPPGQCLQAAPGGQKLAHHPGHTLVLQTVTEPGRALQTTSSTPGTACGRGVMLRPPPDLAWHTPCVTQTVRSPKKAGSWEPGREEGKRQGDSEFSEQVRVCVTECL